MSSFQPHHTSQIQISGIRQFADLVRQYPQALSLTIGQPHFPTPKHIRDAAVVAIEAGQTMYTPNRGLPALREAVSRYYQKQLGLHYRPENEILVTVGATHALDIAMRTVVKPGDDVLIPSPAYPGYAPLVTMLGARLIFVDTGEDDFLLTPDKLEKALTSRTSVLVLASPSNPTGKAYSAAQLAELADVISSKELTIISDEIYSELRFDTPHVSIARIPGMRDKTIVIQGLSKSHSMTGWRIGFTFAPENFTDEMVKVLQYSVTCASTVSQYAALEAMLHGQHDAAPMRDAYRRNRDDVVAAFQHMNVPLAIPDGAFYAFPSIAAFGLSSQLFARRLLDEVGVAVVPGDAFGLYGEGYVRLSYACERETLTQGLERMQQFISSLK